MAYNELLAHKLRDCFALVAMEPGALKEKRMFGGLVFLYKGKMTVGVVKDRLAVRVVPEKMEEILAKPLVGPMDFTKKPMKEFVYVELPALATDSELLFWVELGVEHAKTKI